MESCCDLRFRLDVEFSDVGAPERVIMGETINQGGVKLFPSYWGRWLNRYGCPGPTDLDKQISGKKILDNQGNSGGDLGTSTDIDTIGKS